MWDLDLKEDWGTKNWCFWIVVLEKTLESPLDNKEIKLVNPQGNQSWIFIGRTDAESEAAVFWLPDGKSQLIGKDADCWEGLRAGGEGDDRGWDGWMPSPTGWTWVWANFWSWWWTGSLVCCSPCGHKESDMKCDWTELNWTELNWMKQKIDGFFFSNSLAFSMIQQMLVVSQKSEIKLIQQFHF